MSNPFHGDVLFVDRPTSDGRRFKAGADVAVHPSAKVYTLGDGETSPPVGRIDQSEWPDDGTLTVYGAVDLPPGDYPCGVQLLNNEIEMPVDADGNPDPLAMLADNAEMVFTRGMVEALVVYVGDDAESKPAWPGTHITVTEGDATP